MQLGPIACELPTEIDETTAIRGWPFLFELLVVVESPCRAESWT